MKKAVFIDKDGTLIEDVPYNIDPRFIRFPEGTIDALKILKEHGYLLILVSNQSGVARGYFTEQELKHLEDALEAKLNLHGISIDDYFFCPHHPDGKVEEYAIDCQCRKPKPGMILTAAAKHDIDLSRSWMIGDILNDIEAGNRAGCNTILIDNGNETEWILSDHRIPTSTAKDLAQAARRIMYEPAFTDEQQQ